MILTIREAGTDGKRYDSKLLRSRRQNKPLTINKRLIFGISTSTSNTDRSSSQDFYRYHQEPSFWNCESLWLHPPTLKLYSLPPVKIASL
jgi:hypothetical protein